MSKSPARVHTPHCGQKWKMQALKGTILAHCVPVIKRSIPHDTGNQEKSV